MDPDKRWRWLWLAARLEINSCLRVGYGGMRYSIGHAFKRELL
jgi:hypothetical protein